MDQNAYHRKTLLIAQKSWTRWFWSLRSWGGATFDTCLRFLKEDP